MSKITKTICDKCNTEIPYEDWYFSANITSQSNSYDKGQQIMHGDYCKKCFKETIKKIYKEEGIAYE